MALDGASHLLIVNSDVALECENKFGLTELPDPMDVLHLSPNKKFASRCTSLIPNDALLWTIDARGKLNANNKTDAVTNNQLHIVDRTLFPISPVRKQAILMSSAEFTKTGEPKQALKLAELLIRSGKYRQALAHFGEINHSQLSQHDSWLLNYKSAYCLKKLDREWPEIEQALLAAFDSDPNRIEPLYHLSRHFNQCGDYSRAAELTIIGMDIGQPEQRVTFDYPIYLYKLFREHIYACAWLGKHKDAINTANTVLRNGQIENPERMEIARMRSISLRNVQPYWPVNCLHENQIIVLVAFRNAGPFLRTCVDSLLNQDYSNFKIILIDDASNDGALDSVDISDSRITTKVNAVRNGALSNQLSAIEEYCQARDIIVHVDGDDWLANDTVLTRINQFFNSTHCEILYGQYQDSYGNYGLCEPLVRNDESIEDQIDRMHFPMHVRAYRAELIFQLRQQDPNFLRLRNPQGGYLDAISDMALMRALMPLVDRDRIRFSDEILYIYNKLNPESHFSNTAKLDLQIKQSKHLFNIPLIRHATGSMSPATKKMKAKMLFFALDAMSPKLIEQWITSNDLPNLKSILARCNNYAIQPLKGFGNDCFWNVLCSGASPGDVGYYFRMVWDDQLYSIDYVAPQVQVSESYFWTRLSEQNKQIAVIDIPEVKHGGNINGIEITEWLPHAATTHLTTTPMTLARDLLDRFGVDPLKGSTEVNSPRNESQFARDRDLLLQSIDQKTQGALHYLQRGNWDLFAVGYQQAHDAGHQFWHVHDPTARRTKQSWRKKHGDPLLDIYRRIDHGVGEILSTCDHNTEIVAIAGLGMIEKNSANSALDDILWILENDLAKNQSMPLKKPYHERRFFSVSHNAISGAIRINLDGRESKGMVSPNQYDVLLEKLAFQLSQVVNAHTGESIVEEFVFTHRRYPGKNVNRLPDAFVVWNRAQKMTHLSSPWFEKMPIRSTSMLDFRTGDHEDVAAIYSSINFSDTEFVSVESIAPVIENYINNAS